MYRLILSRGTPSEKYKMNALFEYDQARALAGAGERVVLAGLDLRSLRSPRPLGFSAREEGNLSVRQLDLPLGRLPRALFDFLCARAVRDLFRRIVAEFGPPSVIHAHFTDLARAAAALKRGQIPLVVTEHSSLINQPVIPPPLRAAAAFAYRRADAVVAVSPALRNKIREEFGLEAHYIPNIVDTHLFGCRQPVEREGFTFLSAGNLTENKRMDLTLRAFAAAFAGREDTRLLICGAGPQRELLDRLVQQLGMAGQVTLLGLCSREEIARLLGEAGAFVLASRSETFGVAYAEALSRGVPVIATRCGGPEGFVDSSNGMLVPVDDQRALENALRQMREQAHRYNPRTLSRRIEEEFSPRAVSGRLVELYHGLDRTAVLQGAR